MLLGVWGLGDSQRMIHFLASSFEWEHSGFYSDARKNIEHD